MQNLTNQQITEMAETALTNYELSCSWGKAATAAREHSQDEFGITPRNSAVLLAVKLAKMGWGEIVLRTKREVAA